MDIPPFELVINQIDELIFAETGKHLDDLQYHILEGTVKQLKYSEIAKKNKRTEKYVRDVAGKMWQTLSQVLGTKVGKSNIKSTLQRYYYASLSNVVNALNNVNLNEDNISTNKPEEKQLTNEPKYIQIQLETIADLIKEGLTAEQIARVFKLPLEVVQQQIDQV